MENIRYSPKRLAAILGTTARQVQEAIGKRDAYAPTDLAQARQKLRRVPAPRPRRVQLFLNFKGGTGKTSLSSSYAYRLAERGHRVLLIDLDSQGHATKCLGNEGGSFTRTLLDVLVRKVPLSEVTSRRPGCPACRFVPSNLAMSTVDLALMPLAGREFRLRNALKEAERQYDFVVLDAPPSFGLLNLNALMAADDLVIPVLADFLSFDGLQLLFETVQGLEDDLSHLLENIFIVVNAYNQTFKIAQRGAGRAARALRGVRPEDRGPAVHQVRPGLQRGLPDLRLRLGVEGGGRYLEAVLDEVMTRVAGAAGARAGAAGAGA